MIYSSMVVAHCAATMFRGLGFSCTCPSSPGVLEQPFLLPLLSHWAGSCFRPAFPLRMRMRRPAVTSHKVCDAFRRGWSPEDRHSRSTVCLVPLFIWFLQYLLIIVQKHLSSSFYVVTSREKRVCESRLVAARLWNDPKAC